MKIFSNVPNTVTSLRVFSIPFLLAFAILNMKFAFGIVFLIFGATDAVDGYLARKLKQTTAFGAWYDGFADNLMAVSMFLGIWFLTPEIYTAHPKAMGILVILFLLDLALGYFKYHLMVHYHLLSSKVAAIMVYLFVCILMLWQYNEFAFYSTIAIAALSLVEEIAVTLTSTEMRPNKFSIFRR